MKNNLVIVAFLLSLNLVQGQQQFKLALIFDNKRFTPEYLSVDNTDASCDKLFGYVIQPDGTKFMVHNYACAQKYTPKKIYKTLKGIIDFRDDTVFYLHFWYIKKNKLGLGQTYITDADNEKEFKYVIQWDSKSQFKIPFIFRCFTATTTPFDYDFSSHNINANLLNTNIAYFWVRGTRTFYRNQDIQPRDTYWGVGPFLGIANINGSTDNLSQYGITYGVNIVKDIFGFNIIGAGGLVNGFTSQTSNPHVFAGLGIGFNIVSMTNTGGNVF